MLNTIIKHLGTHGSVLSSRSLHFLCLNQNIPTKFPCFGVKSCLVSSWSRRQIQCPLVLSQSSFRETELLLVSVVDCIPYVHVLSIRELLQSSSTFSFFCCVSSEKSNHSLDSYCCTQDQTKLRLVLLGLNSNIQEQPRSNKLEGFACCACFGLMGVKPEDTHPDSRLRWFGTSLL